VCAWCMVHAGNSRVWPVGIRHQGELSSRPGKIHAAKSLEETMEHIAQELSKICCGESWEQQCGAGLYKLWVSCRRKVTCSKHCMHHSMYSCHGEQIS
jgi:hypothetical protein